MLESASGPVPIAAACSAANPALSAPGCSTKLCRCEPEFDDFDDTVACPASSVSKCCLADDGRSMLSRRLPNCELLRELAFDSNAASVPGDDRTPPPAA